MSETGTFAIVDCNNFYASCERLFAPQLQNHPIVVLSNNDGCVIARSNEAKALGIPMGVPFFKLKVLLHKHKIAVYSSNYALYGDMSRRVMESLSRFTPNLEVYSIDEAFLDLSGFHYRNLNVYGQEIRHKVTRWTGIPVSIGIGATKTLAKAANHIAKRDPAYQGVFNLSVSNERSQLLQTMDVANVWGVGRRWADKLRAAGISTAHELSQCDPAVMRKRFNVVLARTVMELNGHSCIALEEIQPERQQILTSRSFGVRITDLEEMRKAITHFVSLACSKLRRQQLLTQAISVHISTSPHDPRGDYYHKTVTMPLATASDDSRLLLQHAQCLLKRIYRAGYSYQRAGVVLVDLVPRRFQQADLFEPTEQAEGSGQLMQVLDQINGKMGRGTMRFATEGWQGDWQMRQSFRSPAYTTRWDELVKVS